MAPSPNPVSNVTTAGELAGYLASNWEKIALSAAILLGSLALVRTLRMLVFRACRKYDLPPATIRLANSLITYAVAIFAIGGVLSVFDVQLYSLIISMGIISVVIVLGSQLIISNLLGGTVVYIEKPFVRGDIIKVGPDVGVVEGINIRSTTLKGLNGLVITVPNSAFLTTSITNYTRSGSHLVEISFAMPTEVDISGLPGEIDGESEVIPGYVAGLRGVLYKVGLGRGEVQYSLHFWVSDPRRADEARSAVIDIVGRFRTGLSQERQA